MTVMSGRSANRTANIQVWGKGYRGTVDSEEFQRYIPRQMPSLSSPLESRLASISWGKVLSPLYSLSQRELLSERCLFLHTSELMALSFARSEDRHRRPSLILTTATTEIDWQDSNLGDIASRVASLTLRLAAAYAETFKGNPEAVGKQLGNNVFLPSRAFDLTNESLDESIEWSGILAAVKRWQGIQGVSTPSLLSLGANVVLGTKFEAEREQQQFQVDGFYDVRDMDIKPLTSALTPWEQPVPRKPTVVHETAEPQRVSDTRQLAESIDHLAHAMNRVADVGLKVVEYLVLYRRKK